MQDLADDAVSGALLSRRLESGRPLELVCHSPAAMLAAKKPDGSNAFAGRRITALSNVEERLNPFGWKAKWYLQDALVSVGIEYSKKLMPLRPYVVVDGNLYTGQNPGFSVPLAEWILAEMPSRP